MVGGDEGEHAYDDKEALVHGHDVGLDEHTERGVFAGVGRKRRMMER